MPRLLFFLLVTLQCIGQNITRGPYLQMAGPTQMTLRFKTNIPAAMKVLVHSGSSSKIYSHTTTEVDHTFLLDSLQANTKYYYQMGSTNLSIQDSTQFFITAPTVGSNEKVKFGVIGDMYPGATQVKVFNALKKYKGASDYQFMLTLGDNVYSGASDNDYQINFFNVYAAGNFLKQVPVFPAVGNHDYDGSGRIQDAKTMAYFANFNLPNKGQLGGISSNSEAYYSYDYANIHFISLDTEGFGPDGLRLIDDNSEQVKWLINDLEANKSTWKIVYFHHPPFTKGTYDSDVVSILTLVRQKLVPIFEKYKVDLVLNGHSHVYERSKPITNFTGISNAFDPNINWTQSSSGKYDNSTNSCPYFFSSADTAKNGVVYVVNGVGGATGTKRADAPHKVMYYSMDKIGGFMFFEIQDNRLDAKFLTENGDNLDRFTIFKDIPNNTILTKSINYLDKIILTAPWQGDYVWSNGEKTQKIEITPKQNMTFQVTDITKCLSYAYQINVVFPDTDTDGVFDHLDQCLNTPKGQKVDVNGCADSQKDTDGDGVTDDLDICGATKGGTKVDNKGCADYQKDSDNDGVTDDIDLCALSQAGFKVDKNGCADDQKDTDGDGIKDDKDDCPTIVNPSAPIISSSNGIYLSTTGGTTYQWFYNGQIIESATQSNYKAINSGQYTVQMKSQQGCISPISNQISVIVTSNMDEVSIRVFPNPFKDQIQIEWPSTAYTNYSLSLFDVKGSLLLFQQPITKKLLLLPMKNLPVGTYTLLLQSIVGKEFQAVKLLKVD